MITLPAQSCLEKHHFSVHGTMPLILAIIPFSTPYRGFYHCHLLTRPLSWHTWNITGKVTLKRFEQNVILTLKINLSYLLRPSCMFIVANWNLVDHAIVFLFRFLSVPSSPCLQRGQRGGSGLAFSCAHFVAAFGEVTLKHGN